MKTIKQNNKHNKKTKKKKLSNKTQKKMKKNKFVVGIVAVPLSPNKKYYKVIFSRA